VRPARLPTYSSGVRSRTRPTGHRRSAPGDTHADPVPSCTRPGLSVVPDPSAFRCSRRPDQGSGPAPRPAAPDQLTASRWRRPPLVQDSHHQTSLAKTGSRPGRVPAARAGRRGAPVECSLLLDHAQSPGAHLRRPRIRAPLSGRTISCGLPSLRGTPSLTQEQPTQPGPVQQADRRDRQTSATCLRRSRGPRVLRHRLLRHRRRNARLHR